jgi:hypothetical protein
MLISRNLVFRASEALSRWARDAGAGARCARVARGRRLEGAIMNKKAPPPKASPAKVSPAKAARGPAEVPSRFNTKAIGRIFRIVGLMCLVVDVVLSHAFSITLCFWAGVCLAGSAMLNFIAFRCIYTGGVHGDAEHQKEAKDGMVADIGAFINLLALDAFLYEESTYNRWGHSENVLKEERLGAAFIEIAIAGYVMVNVVKQQAKDEMLFADPRHGRSMV